MDLAYELRQLRLFQHLVRRGLIYRRYKPVYWSPSSGTALAEAELEYNEAHVSTAAYVRFPIIGNWRDLLSLPDLPGSLYAIIWTTTPWTLPANRAIAVHDELEYSIVQMGDDAVIVASCCLESVLQACFKVADDVQVLRTLGGDQIRSLQYINALQGKSAVPQPILHGHFVTADSGSGLVHCAPGHGMEDYEVCMALDIPVAAPVDNEGSFTDEAYPDNPDLLKGVSVLEDGSEKVMSLLGQDVLAVHKYTHKYPYDWRTKKPVIVRATAQWFADVASIKDAALHAIDHVKFVPESGKNRLEAFIKGRSEWCISRQRAWGVPIPALYDATGEAVMDNDSIEHIISVIQERGTDAWWSDDASDPAWIPSSLRGDNTVYTRGTDTMDVWFDSGSSWAQMESQADVYLEGSDQHRGWFQSSLLTRVASKSSSTPNPTQVGLGLSPFKTLVTHGFTLDQDGRKMSKSLGNILSADQVMDGSLVPPVKKKKGGGGPGVKDALGPDALRLWTASSDFTKDVVIGEPVLKSVHQSLLRYRTIIKMLLGSMHASARDAPLTALDQIAMIQLRDVMDEVGSLYQSFEFQKAFSALNRWITNHLSAFYVEALKDRLYCADGGGVLEPIFFGLLRMLAPVTPLLVEEAWDHAPAWLKEDK
jgi:isoleucyl-tRNA synthetase